MRVIQSLNGLNKNKPMLKSIVEQKEKGENGSLQQTISKKSN